MPYLVKLYQVDFDKVTYTYALWNLYQPLKKTINEPQNTKDKNEILRNCSTKPQTDRIKKTSEQNTEWLVSEKAELHLYQRIWIFERASKNFSIEIIMKKQQMCLCHLNTELCPKMSVKESGFKR